MIEFPLRRCVAASPSNGNDLDEVFDAGKVASIARIEPRGMRVSGSRDQQIHHTRSRLTARSDISDSKLPVAGGHRIVDGQRSKLVLRSVTWTLDKLRIRGGTGLSCIHRPCRPTRSADYCNTGANCTEHVDLPLSSTGRNKRNVNTVLTRVIRKHEIDRMNAALAAPNREYLLLRRQLTYGDAPMG